MGDATIVKNDPISVLLLDDDEIDRHRINRMSKASGIAIKVEGVATLEAMHVALSRATFDIVILDYQLSHGATGLDALSQLQSNPLQSHVRKIMITGDQRLDTAVRAFKLGCSDFLEKDKLTPDILREAVLSVNQGHFSSGIINDREHWLRSASPTSGDTYQELQNMLSAILIDTLHSTTMKSSLQRWFLEAFGQAARDIDLTKEQARSVVGNTDLAELLNNMRNDLN